ncbi:proline--tRNA ligase [Gorillibacterium sp. sgz500922]|uniref:proline--tRNA ligase n=1 Tax=Gorillibacterium sp. sgz500922 TaxID=3446694 RepID=UPI003F66684E
MRQRQSEGWIPTLKEAPADSEAKSHRLLLRAGYIRQLAAGVYTYLPLGLRVLRKLEAIVREEMDAAGAQEILMPTLQPLELWEESGRASAYGPELVRLADRNGRGFALGPTHEEVVTALIRQDLTSYRQLPVTLYQIHTKYRDERRPRYGLLRCREFRMKDAYSFHADEAGLEETYGRMRFAYETIFRRIGLQALAVEADSGPIGGEGGSHEFMALAESGEDTLLVCPACGYGANVEAAEGRTAADACPRCGKPLSATRGIEVGHVFKLGTKYSAAMNALAVGADGKQRPVLMGCYGIGVSRLLAAVAEQHADDAGLNWPAAVAPYQIHLLLLAPRDEEQRELAEQVSSELELAGYEVLLDDREERPGVKFHDADLIGLPLRLTVGKDTSAGRLELAAGRDKRLIAREEVLAEAAAILRRN